MKPYLVLKKVLDFIFAMVLLIIVSPIMVIAAIAIKIEDPKGKSLFKQERIGKDSEKFKVYKFRTMKVETNREGKMLSDIERITKIGSFLRKTSIDELPQLFNILRGEMSFIGPRPLPVIYFQYYTNEELHRHDVTPGISGWAQVNGRNYLAWEKKFQYDLEYVKNIGIIFDVKILLLTIRKVFGRADVGVRGIDFADESLHEIRKPRGRTSF